MMVIVVIYSISQPSFIYLANKPDANNVSCFNLMMVYFKFSQEVLLYNFTWQNDNGDEYNEANLILITFNV